MFPLTTDKDEETSTTSKSKTDETSTTSKSKTKEEETTTASTEAKDAVVQQEILLQVFDEKRKH